MSADASAAMLEQKPNPELARYNTACIDLITYATDLITQKKPETNSLLVKKHDELVAQHGLEPKMFNDRVKLVGECALALQDYASALGLDFTKDPVGPPSTQLTAYLEEKQEMVTTHGFTDELMAAQFDYYNAMLKMQNET